jgi:hypothetical protein
VKNLLITVALGAALSSWPAAQEKPKSDSAEKTAPKHELTPLRVQIVFAEYDGEKKISSLPYTLLVNADNPRGPKASIRMGLRVPVETSPGPATQLQYMDLGTNIDGWSSAAESGRFALHLLLERSNAYSEGTTKPSSGSFEVTSKQPVIQRFSTEVDLLLRDGQTIQSTLASDPISGRVSKVEVTLTVVK